MYRIYYYVLIAFITICPSVCESATVNYNIGGYAIGINDLVVGSEHYNVVFEYGSFSEIFTTPPETPYFWGAEDKTLAAIDSINLVLNGEETIPDIIETQNLNTYYIPYEYVNFPGIYWVNTHQGSRSGDDLYDNDYGVGEQSGKWPNDSYYYAKLTAVPLPATVFLLGSGLIGIVGIRRKFKPNK